MTNTTPNCTRPFCSIVPPYVLDALAASGDPELQRIAEQTLRHDQALRAQRRPGPGQVRSSTEPGPGKASEQTERREIHDANHGTTLPGKLVRSEGDAAGSDVSVNEAYDGLGDTFALYSTAYGRNSIDNAGLTLLGSVHYSRNYDNAFWNGEQMVFGDGDGVVFVRFTGSVDVIGHELTHGVTQYTAALVYNDQPGALNESISDVFGSLVKQYALGQTADRADWLIGAGILGPKIKGRALRDMLHPGTAYNDPQLGADPQPADMQHYVTTSDDNGGVHINSGIPNRAFALAATTVGGKAWEGVGQVWYDVLTGTKIQARCDFATFAQLTIDAAVARFGAGDPVAEAVRSAWATVGVLGASTSGSTTASDGGSTGSTAEVEVRRTGGFAGISKQTRVRLDQLPDRDAEAWQSLLGAPQQLHRLAASSEASQARDGYSYSVTSQAYHVDITVAEHLLPVATRHLFERTLDLD